MEKVWLKNYPQSIPPEIQIDSSSIYAEFKKWSLKYNPQIAFENYGEKITFKQWRDKSSRLASYLIHHCNLKKGDRVALQIPNLLQSPIVIMGVLQAGLTVVNINPLYTAREIKEVLKDSEPQAFIVFSHSAHEFQKIEKEINIPHVIVTDLGELFSFHKKILFHVITHYIKKIVHPFHLPSSISLTQALKIGSKYPTPEIDIQEEDLAFLQYTGGTTGTPKGAMLTQKNVLSNVKQGHVWMTPYLKQKEEKAIVALPLYHIFALSVNLLILPFYGAHSILITNPRDTQTFIKTLKSHHFTVFVGVNSLFKLLLKKEEFKTVNFSFLKVSLAGGTSIEKYVFDKWIQVTKNPIIEGYGLTEASPVVCCNILSQPQLGSCGYPFPSTEIRVVNSKEEELSLDQVGHLQVRGPQVMKGYWKNKEETQKTINSKGWLSTGDMAKVSPSGLVYIQDRIKDIILVSGFNVYPNEIENVIASHPKVKQVAVIGVPDSFSSEVPKAFIVKSDPDLTSEEVIHFCKENLTGYKIPKYIEFRSELPLSSVGKVLRRKLR